ncbi:MAG: hypothetical protein ACREQ5_27010, partial [Candidatus Dormibacteria bacterium]
MAPIVPDDGLKTVVYSIYPQSDAVKIKIIVYDSSGKIVALPQDVFEGSFEDVVNGGSGAGNFKVPKRFVDSGWINFGYRVQVFLYDGPGDPWYDGFVTEIDPAQDATLDLETQNIHTQGWSSHMAFAIVTETLSPGVQPNGVDNGQYNADTYLSHLVATYYDATVLGPTYIASIPVALDALTFDGQSLDKCIDAIVKQVSDNTGHVFEWWVRGVANGKPALVIQQQSNPALVTTNFFSPAQRLTTSYFTEFQDSTIDSYTIHSDASGLANQIALYGYTAPSTGIQLYGAFQDSTSISLYTLRQKKVTNTTLVSQQSLINYATVYLLLNGYPQPQGRFNKLVASDFARAGQYFQILQPGLEAPDYEYIVTPATGQLAQAAPQVLQQVRAIKVTLSFGTGQDRIL